MMPFTWFTGLRTKLLGILIAVVGFMALYINVLKKDALQKEIKNLRATSRGKDKANKALSDGLENENVKVKRGYFSKKP